MRWFWALVLLVGCGRESPAPAPSASGAAPSASVTAAVASDHDSPPRCSEALAAVQKEAELAGAPALEARRAAILASAKAEPVVFIRAPRFADDVTDEVRIYRRQLLEAAAPGYRLSQMREHLLNRPEVARGVLLREGYLYAENPALAAGMVEHVKLRHLFTEPEIVVQRGSRLLPAVLGDKDYEHAAGERKGERVSLLLFDRVWPKGQPPGPALHRALRGLQEATGAERVRIEHLAAGGVVAKLRYGAAWIPTLLRHEGATLVRECELIDSDERPAVEHARDLSFRKRRVLAAEHRAISKLVDERLPFDEPKTEEGQQDGNLRPKWEWAYDHGWFSYSFNDDHYPVFDYERGHPLVPQVCVDFVLDTLERASGTWWRTEGEARERIAGRLDFDELGLDNRRSVERFVNFAWQNPQWFDAYDLGKEERVPFYKRDEFFGHLELHADRYSPGDIVTIHGPRGPEGEVHYHSFFIYEADPISGMPTQVAANAGKPRIRTWEREMRVAPRRSIRSRIRPHVQWLETVLSLDEQVSLRTADAAGEAG